MKIRLKADLLLFVVALIWGAAFITQGIAASHGLAYLFNGVSFILASLVLRPFIPGQRKRAGGSAMAAVPGRRKWLLVAGCLLFAGTALQQVGLLYTQVANAGFLTSLYVVLTPLLLWAAFHERPHAFDLVAVIAAAGGAWLLATGGGLTASAAFKTSLFGDSLEIVGALFWAAHFVVLGKFAPRFEPLAFASGQFMIAGVLNLAVGLLVEPVAALASPDLLGAILFRASISIGIGYTLQVWGQRHTPPTDAALILGLEAVFAAIAGWLAFHQNLSPARIMGCVIIFAAVILAQAKDLASHGSKQPGA